MDHARKIGKSKKQTQLTKTRPCKIPAPCSCAPTDTPPVEDRRLVNWKRWLSDRQRRQEHLTKVLGRKPIDLALNAHERVRGKVETCSLLQAARTEVTNQDKGRGNPIFWRSVDHPLDDEENDVIAQLDRDARNLPPDLTRVALPKFIVKEKKLLESCVAPSTIRLASKWECGDYLRTRLSELKQDMDVLEEKKPEMEDLIIVGKQIQSGDQEKTLVRNPVITITPPDCKRRLLSNPDERLALKIQDREFVLEKGKHFEKLSFEESETIRQTHQDKDEKKYIYSVFDCNHIYSILPKKSKSVVWSLSFESVGNEICTRYLILENKGVQVINLYWRKEPKPNVSFTTPTHLDSQFFFDKNQLTILPGQKIEVPLWFRSERPLVSSETWRLITIPKIYPGILRLRLWAIAHGCDWKKSLITNCEKVRCHLKRRVRNMMVRQVVNEIISRATIERQPDDVPYNSFFLEKDLFKARNPNHYYRSVQFNELKALHDEVTGDCGCKWNLSLIDLKSQVMDIKDPDKRRDKLGYFRQLCHECLTPNLLYRRGRCTKDQIVYRLLCGFADEFEIECEMVLANLRTGSNFDENEDEDEGEEEEDEIDYKLYREVIHVRISCLLGETIDRVCAAIDTKDYLSDGDDC